jgi:hypothetical protein
MLGQGLATFGPLGGLGHSVVVYVMRHAAASTYSFCDVGGPFPQTWDLLGLLPRHKASVDRLVEVFVRESTH